MLAVSTEPMSYLDAEPTLIDDTDSDSPWGRFRERDSRRCLADLREACQGSIPVTIFAPRGRSMIGSIWAIDDVNKILHFKIESNGTHFSEILGSHAPWAVFYLGEVKVQFALLNACMSGHAKLGIMRTDIPIAVYRLIRRRESRLSGVSKPLGTIRIRAVVADEGDAEPGRMPLADISAGGCAFLRQNGEPRLAIGTMLERIEVELFGEVAFGSDAKIMNITADAHDPSLVRVGAAWSRLEVAGLDLLRQWTQRGQCRRDFISLKFDL